MYRCSLCAEVSQPGQPLLRFTLYQEHSSHLRRQGDIAREIPVCRECQRALHLGIPLADRYRQMVAHRRMLANGRVVARRRRKEEEAKTIVAHTRRGAGVVKVYVPPVLRPVEFGK